MGFGRRIKSQWFSLALVGLFALAWVAPAVPRLVNVDDVAKYACVVLIFFLTGLVLKTEEALRGLASWRVHIFVQGFSFGLVPLVCWLALRPWVESLPEGLVIGFYLLAAVPTTITSCVVLTQLAGGNFAAALFNAVLGNILGVVVSPALLLVMIGTSELSVELDARRILTKLALVVLLPLACGQLAHRLRVARGDGLRRVASYTNRICILLIVYFAFGNLFSEPPASTSFRDVFLPLLALVPAHLVLLVLSYTGARVLGLRREDRVAVVFCAPQKTLGMGLPLLATALASRPDLVGMASLPLVLYHALQLLVAGLLVDRLRHLETPARVTGE